MDADLQPHIPITEVVGTNRVLIENYISVTDYDTNRIYVEMEYGFIEISGIGLSIARLTKEQVLIEGEVDFIRLNRGDAKIG